VRVVSDATGAAVEPYEIELADAPQLAPAA